MCIDGESEREISKAVDGYGQIERDKRTEPLWVNLWAVKGGANCFCLFCFQKFEREKREREPFVFRNSILGEDSRLRFTIFRV